jgi:polyferredoxin
LLSSFSSFLPFLLIGRLVQFAVCPYTTMTVYTAVKGEEFGRSSSSGTAKWAEGGMRFVPGAHGKRPG